MPRAAPNSLHSSRALSSMHADAARTLQAAQRHCEQQGLRLTPGRSRLLQALTQAGEPSTAYDLLEQLQASQAERIHPQTVYRALDFLCEAGLIHRIASTGQFILCEHVQCSHQHRPSQFLVCSQCGNVAEMELEKEYLDSFAEQMQRCGFRPNTNGIEIHGLCANCCNPLQ